jgi:hypothetical protein
MANIGLGQHRGDGYKEQPLLTLGAELTGAHELIEKYPGGWSAVQAVSYLLKVGP